MRFLDMQSALDFVWANESLCPLEVLVDSGPLRTHDVISANRPVNRDRPMLDASYGSEIWDPERQYREFHRE